MANITHTCTGCVPIDSAIIGVFAALVGTDKYINDEESERQAAEESRVAAEAARASAEVLRSNAENARVMAEGQRDNAEDSRVEAEEARDWAEQGRINREGGRVRAEQDRESAEGTPYDPATSDTRWGVYKRTLAAIDLANEAAAAAEAAAGNIPYIGNNGHWFIYDPELETYVDSGEPAQGPRGIQGPQGAKGDTGATGATGPKGDTGVSADYPITIYNGLDSDATDEALAAAQGKVLDGKISQLGQKVFAFENFATVDEDGLFFVDSELNIGAFLDSDGIHAKNILDYDLITV